MCAPLEICRTVPHIFLLNPARSLCAFPQAVDCISLRCHIGPAVCELVLVPTPRRSIGLEMRSALPQHVCVKVPTEPPPPGQSTGQTGREAITAPCLICCSGHDGFKHGMSAHSSVHSTVYHALNRGSGFRRSPISDYVGPYILANRLPPETNPPDHWLPPRRRGVLAEPVPTSTRLKGLHRAGMYAVRGSLDMRSAGLGASKHLGQGPLVSF